MPLNESFVMYFELATCDPISRCIKHLKGVADNLSKTA